MKLTKVLMAVAVIATISFVSCKPKDADILKSIQEKIATMPDMKDMKVEVKDGVATLSGECKDPDCKAACEKAVTGIKGVKSVVNNCTVAPPPPPPPASTNVNVAVDAMVQKKITDGLKDIAGAKVMFEGKKAIFSGTFTASQKTTLQQLCGSAGVAADMSKATIK
jgi:hyperosmotically inducible periplasmic protein